MKPILPLRICLLSSLFVCLCSELSLPVAQSAELIPSRAPVIPGYERVYNVPPPPRSEDEEDEEEFDEEDAVEIDRTPSGQVLLGELGCVKCHQVTDEVLSQLFPKQAPILTEVGDRVRPEFLKQFLASPHATKPGTTMPNLFEGVEAKQADEEIEALVHFLTSTGDGPVLGFPSPAMAKRGRDLFHKVGCMACHSSPEENGKDLSTSVPLGPVDKKYTIASLTKYLQNPLHVRPSGRMPSLNLSDKEARNIACYLLRDVEGIPNVNFDYYEGDWRKVPDFDSVNPVESGQTTEIGIDLAHREDDFAFRFHSNFLVPEEGDYRFTLGSDDGSKLWINGKLIIDYDNVHGFDRKKETIRLTKGWHTFQVGFFEHGGDARLLVEIEGPGLSRRSLSEVSSVDPVAQQSTQTFKVDQTLAQRGKTVFQNRGCANCHELKQNDKLLPSSLNAKSLASLSLGAGCMKSESNSTTPDYALSDQQLADLKRTLVSIQKDELKPLKGDKLVSHTMTTFNCYACHARGEIGGPELSRDQWFTSTIPEMGDEGRRPPALTGVGDKLQTDWLKHVLDSGADERPYMHTRMPKFGMQNVGALVDQFASLDQLSEIEASHAHVAEYRLQGEGRKFVGEKMMACIKCHTFGKHKATGIQSVDMLRLTKRVRKDWFQRYLINPQKYRKGTRMPAFFFQGKTMFPEVLDGEVSLQVDALWAYLEMGDKAAIPDGLGKSMIELKAEKEPLIYRNFIEGLSPRGIAVGYPEGANIAFDADLLSLGLIWHGRFMDASRHWTGRGQGFQPPLGDHVVSLVRGVPFSSLDDQESAWPTKAPRELGFRFRGYQFDQKRRPIFLYSTAEYQVSDHLVPVAGQPDSHFERRLSVTFSEEEKPTQNLYYRLAAAQEIRELGGGRYQLDGALVIHVDEQHTQPLLRNSGEQQELILPVQVENGVARIVLRYEW